MELALIIILTVAILFLVAVVLYIFKYFTNHLNTLNETSQQNYLSWTEQLNKSTAYWVDNNNKVLVDKVCHINEEWADQFAFINSEWSDFCKKLMYYYEDELYALEEAFDKAVDDEEDLNN